MSNLIFIKAEAIKEELLVSHVLSQQQGFPVLLAKKMQPAPALGSG